MKKIMNWLKNEESGQGMVEYGLIIALVAVVLIGALVGLRGGLENIFGDAETVLNDPSSAVTN
ncbi:MAG: Flp family type IVb pilin [Sedimentibacter sp.]